MSRVILSVLFVGILCAAHGQQKNLANRQASEGKADTVIVSLAKTSKVVFTMQDRSDLETLKHYNFQELFQDILLRLERSDSALSQPDTATDSDVAQETAEEDWSSGRSNNDDGDDNNSFNNDDDDDDEWNRKVEYRRGRRGRTWQSFNFDLGTNNYLADGEFPDNDNALYAVRPWGSWYIAGSSIQRTRVGRNFFLEWGLGISWYNFKFENDAVQIQKTDSGVEFVLDPRDVNHIKSKLTATYVNASFVPVIDFGDHGRKPRMWDGYGNSFRIGIGPYVGYRISSRSKMVIKDDDGREKEKDRSSFYLNNLRYGARLQIGFRSTDLFFNYDLNELFSTDKGPKLNAFSFGVIF
ncbi:MAG: hypothetical protein ACOYXT_07930 [Bacteroidota bacterium]